MKIPKKAALFAIGGGAYVGLELLWRGYSHASMFAAGGACFLLLGRIGKTGLPLAVKTVLGAGAITAVELTAGLLVNRDYLVWDYRSLPGNYLGQICPTYTLLWFPVALLGMGLYRTAEKKLSS